MLLTKELEQWIYSNLDKYAKQMGISKYQMPIAVLTQEELSKVPTHITWNYTADKVKTNKGVTYWGHDHNLISFINVKRHRSMKDLEDTLVHELLHVRMKYLSHGKTYDKMVKAIMNGKTLRPYKERK